MKVKRVVMKSLTTVGKGIVDKVIERQPELEEMWVDDLGVMVKLKGDPDVRLVPWPQVEVVTLGGNPLELQQQLTQPAPTTHENPTPTMQLHQNPGDKLRATDHQGGKRPQGR